MEQAIAENKVMWTKRVRMMPVDDITQAVRAIRDDWGNDVLTGNTTPALVLSDLCYYAGIDPVEALGPELAAELRKRGV